MPKFKTGFVVGVATGYLCSGAIEVGLRRFAAFVDEKTEEVERKKQTTEPKSYADEATLSNPASGTKLPSMRIQEINASSPDNPVVLTNEDIDAMDVMYIKAHIKSGRFTLIEGSEA